LKFACLTPIFAVFLAGCISNIPADLAVTSVQAVDWRDQDEMPGPGASGLLGMVPPRVLAAMGQSVKGGPKPSRLLLKIEFTSTVNLAKYAFSNSYTLGINGYFCDRPGKGGYSAADFIGLSVPSVYWRGMEYLEYDPDKIDQFRGGPGRPITYYIYIRVMNNETRWLNEPDEGFNLMQNPRDICFVVRGGNNTGFGYKSNIVVISKDAIITALRNRPPGFDN